jgi:hypothetical protein
MKKQAHRLVFDINKLMNLFLYYKALVTGAPKASRRACFRGLQAEELASGSPTLNLKRLAETC